MATLDKVKTALRRSDTVFDEEIGDLIAAARADLQLAGVSNLDTEDPLVLRAVTTYCRAHFGDAANGEYDRLSEAYDRQKAQLGMATGYTDWGDGNGDE
jgi:hypothetical protein